MNNSKAEKIGLWLHSRISEAIKCFPIIAENGTTFPFAIYQRTGTETVYTNDFIAEEVASITINVISDKYSESINKVIAVRNALEREYPEYITSIRLVSSSEAYQDEAFVQTLSYEIAIYKQ